MEQSNLENIEEDSTTDNTTQLLLYYIGMIDMNVLRKDRNNI